MKGNFDRLINTSSPLLVDFHAEWCGPCKMLAPVLEEVTAKLNGQAKIIKIDVDKNPAIAHRFQVRGVPTLILFKNGRVLWRQSGVPGQQQLLEGIRHYSQTP